MPVLILTILLLWFWPAHAVPPTERLVPLGDPASEPFLPTTISEQPLILQAAMAELFQDEDNIPCVRLTGEVDITLEPDSRQRLRSRSAVVWLNPRTFEGRKYWFVEILLWQDVVIRDHYGTTTEGPLYFVTLNTFADAEVQADSLTYDSSMDSQEYQEGLRLRKAFRDRLLQQDPVAWNVIQPGVKPIDSPAPNAIFTGSFLASRSHEINGRKLITASEVFFTRSIPGKDDYVEIMADDAVVFLPRDKSTSQHANPSEGSESDSGMGGISSTTQEKDGSATPTDGGDRGPFGSASFEVDAIYLEGDVRMTQGASTIRAERIYYDPRVGRAIILDAIIKTELVERGVPLYIRADEIRQLSDRHYVAEKAMLTTSEFHTPHYHIGASRVELIDQTPVTASGERSELQVGTFKIYDSTLIMGGIPFLYWPYATGTLDSSETAFQSIRMGYSKNFGAEIETRWDFFTLMGLERPEGVKTSLSLDAYTERGAGIGLLGTYERDEYFGLVRSYLLAEQGIDNLGRERESDDISGARGRFLVRHRQYLENDWQLSLEFSYISDRGFLEEFFEREFDLDKDQETLIYLKKQKDTWAFQFTTQWRILDFYTQVERLPDMGFFVVGESLGRNTTFFSENRVGAVRLRNKDQTLRELLREGFTRDSGVTPRADTRQELTRPIDIGAVRLVPFVSGRASAWDDSLNGGGEGRVLGMSGIRGSMYFWRVYQDVRSELFDIDGIRHTIKPQFVVFAGGTNVQPTELYQFDRTVEGADDVDGVTFGVRQRWQTKRGEGANRRIVDVVTQDVSIGVFNDADNDLVSNGFTSYTRPESSVARNFINHSLIWRVNDRTAALSEINYDMNDGSVDIFNVSVAVDRNPRFSYLIGYRFIGETDSNLIRIGTNYRMTEKYTLAVREDFDFDRNRSLDFTLGIIRKFPRWYAALSFEVDTAEDDFGVTLGIWPEGLPNFALGSRRFTGLSDSVRITPD